MTTYQGVSGAMKTGQEGIDSSYGRIPNNGILGLGIVRAIGECRDGLSNSQAIREFIHRDKEKGDYVKPPGNVRPWILGDNGDKGMYSIKSIEHTVNADIDRVADGVAFNHLPMGSYHTGGANFCIGDGSVRFLSNSINFTVYESLATVNAGEVALLPE